MKKKNQTRIRKEFKTGSSHVATRLYTTSRPFLPLLGDYSRRCEGFKLADEMRFMVQLSSTSRSFLLNFRGSRWIELSNQISTSSGGPLGVAIECEARNGVSSGAGGRL